MTPPTPGDTTCQEKVTPLWLRSMIKELGSAYREFCNDDSQEPVPHLTEPWPIVKLIPEHLSLKQLSCNGMVGCGPEHVVVDLDKVKISSKDTPAGDHAVTATSK